MARRGRPRTITDSELRERMFTTANQMLEDAGGVALSLDQAVTFERVVGVSDVGRSAAFRVFPTKDAFLAEWRDHLAAPLSDESKAAAYDPQTLVVAAHVFWDRRDQLHTLSDRRAALREAIRLGAWQNFLGLTTRPTWKIYNALALTMNSIDDAEQRESLRQHLVISDTTFIKNMAAFYEQAGKILGLRPRKHYENVNYYELIAKLGGAIVEGLALHDLTDSDFARQRFTYDDGDWSAASLGFLAVFERITELDERDDFTPDRGALDQMRATAGLSAVKPSEGIEL